MKALKKFSLKKIVVVTDAIRNEIAIVHETVIDIKTPIEYNCHQACVFLKTSLHRFLPKGNLCCYIDIDVVAISEELDSIFDYYSSSIIFATDHCKLNEFSPLAVDCGCLAKGNELMKAMNDFKKKQSYQLEHFNQYAKDLMAEIEMLILKIKENRWVCLMNQFRCFFGRDFYHLNN